MDQITPNNSESLEKELDRARRELSVLYEISSAMRTTLELKHILYIILTGVTSHTGLGFNRAILFLVNEQERCLEPQLAIGPESLEDAQKIWGYISAANQRLDDLVQEDKIDQHIGQKSLFKTVESLKIPLGPANDNLLVKSFQNGKPLHITSDRITAYAQDPLLKVFHTNELVIMPLKVKSRVNGLIIADNLYTRKPIAENDLKMFTMLANQAGLAIENSRLYEMTKHKSHTDALTNLWNHGFFQDALGKEIEKAFKLHQTVGLMMIDIDDFKKLNDRYGHQHGDLILKTIAHILREASRENDFACRYGGEEFAVIFTQADPGQCRDIAERLRLKIADHLFDGFGANPQLRVTVSIGLAFCPSGHAGNKEELITQADKAMYIAKFGGKNQYCCA